MNSLILLLALMLLLLCTIVGSFQSTVVRQKTREKIITKFWFRSASNKLGTFFFQIWLLRTGSYLQWKIVHQKHGEGFSWAESLKLSRDEPWNYSWGWKLGGALVNSTTLHTRLKHIFSKSSYQRSQFVACAMFNAVTEACEYMSTKTKKTRYI